LTQAFTLPAISVPHWAQSGATSKVIRPLNTPDLAALSEKSRDKSRTHLRMALVGHPQYRLPTLNCSA
jgi:hypothetical protein